SGVAGRGGRILERLAARDQGAERGFTLCIASREFGQRGIEEAAVLAVLEAREHGISDLLREAEVAQVRGGLIGVEAGDGGEAIVIEQTTRGARRGLRVRVGDDVTERAALGVPSFSQN